MEISPSANESTPPTQTSRNSIQRIGDIYKDMKALTNDQDFSQKMNVSATLVLEFYRVLMGSLLVVFVPQSCGDHVCSLGENMERDDISRAAFACNLLTLFAFCAMYYVEVKREHMMIDNLHVNPEKPRDNDAVGESIALLEDSVKLRIWDLDKIYQWAGYFSMGCFSANACMSAVPIFSNYLDDKTVTVMLTNLLFMGSKLNDVFSIVKTEKNIFFSAYLKRKVQFNDIDPDAPIKDMENPSEASIYTSMDSEASTIPM
jgi:hypothetical protein